MRLALLALMVALSGCLMTQYVAQAAHGQLVLLDKARPIDEVVADPDTPLRTAVLLNELGPIKQYGRSYGLRIVRNYKTFSYLGPGRPAAVWFVGGADPLAFKPLKWCFPIAGCFAGLGWFDEDDAVKFKQQLDKRGLDTLIRPAAAYSTGGWFPDPVLSTMIGGGDDAFPELANVILHESVHATVFVADEPFFNESIAEYTADVLTDHWITVRFGRGSPEELAWTLGQALGVHRTARTLQAYKDLKALYESDVSRDQKLAKKAAIIDDLVSDLRLRRRPNNASLTESRVYNGGADALIDAHRACGDIRKFILAAKTLKRSDFTKSLQEDLAPVSKVIAERCRKL
ncbi:MAG TPA: aminopeptidase [Kofleriaceae bacterium]